MSQLFPAVFIGHGNPMNAIEANDYSRAWELLALRLPAPKAILCISAHWYVPQTAVTAMPHPRTIHDFGGFPRVLFEVRYPAPGDAALAERVAELLEPVEVERDQNWGLDHGAWSVLIRMFPDAQIPVVQLSIDERQPPRFHYELGKKLTALRAEGVLLLGSGNIVHNLEAYAWGNHASEPYPWASRFEQSVRELLRSNQSAPLVDYPELGDDALLAIPTPDHYLPFLYVLGAREPDDALSFPVSGVDGGSISMLAVQFG